MTVVISLLYYLPIFFSYFYMQPYIQFLPMFSHNSTYNYSNFFSLFTPLNQFIFYLKSHILYAFSSFLPPPITYLVESGSLILFQNLPTVQNLMLAIHPLNCFLWMEKKEALYSWQILIGWVEIGIQAPLTLFLRHKLLD